MNGVWTMLPFRCPPTYPVDTSKYFIELVPRVIGESLQAMSLILLDDVLSGIVGWLIALGLVCAAIESRGHSLFECRRSNGAVHVCDQSAMCVDLLVTKHTRLREIEFSSTREEKRNFTHIHEGEGRVLIHVVDVIRLYINTSSWQHPHDCHKRKLRQSLMSRNI